ncbi:cyclin N-terminal domain-containing protein 1-like isoform X2 [Tachypleus tridentatus]
MACGTTGNISELMEPAFSSEFGTVSVDLLEDWLFLIALKNSENVVDPVKSKCNWTSGKVVESIFNVCEWSQEPIEVSFTAVELFDQFLIHHVQDLYLHVEKSKKSTRKRIVWQIVEERIQKQMMLRVVSCVQLASKQHSHCRAVNLKKARSLLCQAGHSYGLDSILNSELRVLKTLNYKVNVCTPFYYLETLVEVLCYNNPSISARPLFTISVKLLQFTYINREKIYQHLSHNLAMRKQIMLQQNKGGCHSIKSDYLLLSLAIIAASGHFTMPGMEQKITQQLHEITNSPVEDITDFSNTILSVVLEHGHIVM